MATTDDFSLEGAIRHAEPLLPCPEALPDMAVTLPAEEASADPICAAVLENDVPDVVLKAVIYGFAEEQASLRNLRQKKATEGKDSSGISIRRGQLLKYMSETLIQKQALMGMTGEIDFRGPKFREVFKMFLETISDTFDEVKIPTEFKEMFFHALSKNLEGWEVKAEKVVKKMSAQVE